MQVTNLFRESDFYTGKNHLLTPVPDIYGGIFLSPTCKINYVKLNMQDNYVFMQHNHDSMRLIYVHMRLMLICK